MGRNVLGGVDAHYTPEGVAQRIVDSVAAARVGRAVDFAAGDGALLRAANRRFPTASLFATDVFPPTVRNLRASRPDWTVGVCDFLEPRSRASSQIARSGQRYDLVLLNPPFSFRGQRGRAVTFPNGMSAVASPAAAFTFVAAPFVAPDGQLLVLLPAGSLRSQKDRAIWQTLSLEWLIEPVADFGRGAFAGLAAKTTLVSLERKRQDAPSHPLHVAAGSDRRPSEPGLAVRVVRGCIARHLTRRIDSGRPFLHTTGLTPTAIIEERVEAAGGRETAGPAVLIPRVGNPSPWKIKVRMDSSPVLLSDCVIALECPDPATAHAVAERLLADWSRTSSFWSGSCAPYITLEALRLLLSELGIDERAVRVPSSQSLSRRAA
jgi:hypothetical protein